MAALIKKLDRLRRTPLGRMAEALLYAVMLGLALIYFSGGVSFLYQV